MKKQTSWLTENEQRWLKLNRDDFTYEEISDRLNITQDRVRTELQIIGVKKKRTMRKMAPFQTKNKEDFSQREYDAVTLDEKIKKVKEMACNGEKIGPYNPITPYKHFVLCINKKGHKENFMYQELARYIKG